MNNYKIFKIEKTPYLFFTVIPNSFFKKAEIKKIYREINKSISPFNIVSERVFGVKKIYDNILKVHEGMSNSFTFVEGEPCNNDLLAGIQICAFNGEVESVKVKKSIVGQTWNWGGDKLYCIQNIKGESFKELYGKIDNIVPFKNVIKTKFHIKDMKNYKVLVNERLKYFLPMFSKFLARFKPNDKLFVKDRSAPVAVVVGGSTDNNLTLDVWAVDFKNIQYSFIGKNFLYSQMNVLRNAGLGIVLMAGTATIDSSDNTVFQVNAIIMKINKFLSAEDMTFQDNLAEAVFYLKKKEDFKLIQKNMNLSSLPVIYIEEKLCSEDLLIEIDSTFV